LGHLQGVEGAEQAHAHGERGVLHHRVDARDRRHVHEDVGIAGGGAQRLEVHHVALHQLHIGVREQVGAGQGIAVQVVEQGDAVVGAQALGEGAADEPGPAGDENVGVANHGVWCPAWF
jgi:hypothetical protein